MDDGMRPKCVICKATVNISKDISTKCSGNCGSIAHAKCISTDSGCSSYRCVHCSAEPTTPGSPALSGSEFEKILLGQKKLFETIVNLTKKVDTLSTDNIILKTLLDDSRKETSDLRLQVQQLRMAIAPSYSDIVRPPTDPTNTHRHTKNPIPGSSNDAVRTPKSTTSYTPSQQPTAQQQASLHSQLSHSGRTPDADGFVLHTSRSRRQQPLVESAGTNKQRRPDTSQLGARTSTALKVASNVRPRTKALFVTRFDPSVTEREVADYLQHEASISYLKVVKLKTKFDSYSTFYVAVAEKEFPAVFNPMMWPEGILLKEYKGPLKDSRVYQQPDPPSSPTPTITSQPPDPTQQLQVVAEVHHSLN